MKLPCHTFQKNGLLTEVEEALITHIAIFPRSAFTFVDDLQALFDVTLGVAGIRNTAIRNEIPGCEEERQ